MGNLPKNKNYYCGPDCQNAWHIYHDDKDVAPFAQQHLRAALTQAVADDDKHLMIALSRELRQYSRSGPPVQIEAAHPMDDFDDI